MFLFGVFLFSAKFEPFDEVQSSVLLEKFSNNGYPTRSEIEEIAKEIDDDPERVKVKC